MHLVKTRRSAGPHRDENPNRVNFPMRLNDNLTTIKESSNGLLVARLTDDILLAIFLLLYSLWDSPGGSHSRRSELAVCRRWRRLILSAPVLWRKVYYPDAKPGYRYLNLLSFEQSKPVLLDLTIRAHLKQQITGTVPWKLVAQHAHRVRLLHIIAHDIDELNETSSLWGQLNTSNLKTVLITGENIYDDGQAAIPTDANNRCLGVEAWPTISSLISLSLIGYSPFQFPSAPNLRNLYISSMKLTTKGLRDIMRQFPMLESLAIDKLYPWYNRKREDGYDRDVICMPALRKLALGSGRQHDEGCLCAMGCIATPNLELLELRCTSSVLNDEHLATLLQPENTKHLRKIRLAVAEITLEDIPFLATLPSITDLELPQLDRHTNYAGHILVALLELANFNSITLYIQPRVALHGMLQASNAVYVDKAMFCNVITRDQPKIGSPLCLRGLDADVKRLPFECAEFLGGEVRTTGLHEGEPWIIPEWDSLEAYEFSDLSDDDLESGADSEDDEFDESDYGWDSSP